MEGDHIGCPCAEAFEGENSIMGFSLCLFEPFLVTSLKDFSSTSALDKQLVRWRVLA